MSPNRKRSRSFSAQVQAHAGQPDAFTLFRAQMNAGDYDALVGRKLRRALREAAAIPNLDAEIGALRLALVRLIKEEPDPSRLSVGVARLGAVAVQVARLRQQSHDGPNEIHAHLARVLAEIDAEAEAEAARSSLPPLDEPQTTAPSSHAPWEKGATECW